MTTHDREKIIAAVKEAGFSEKQWSAMVCQSGPYEINIPTICLTDFYAIAFEAGRESLRQQLEIERVRLAACGIVAMANTPESAAKAREMLPQYRSASCDDVSAAVDREITLRQRNGDLVTGLEACDEQVVALRQQLAAAQDDFHFQACLTRELLPYQERAINAEQQLAAAQTEISELHIEIDDCHKRLAAALAAIKVKDEALDAVTKCIGAGKLRIVAAEALATTEADLGRLVLCEKNPVACYQGHDKASGWETITLLESIPEGTNLFVAWRPK